MAAQSEVKPEARLPYWTEREIDRRRWTPEETRAVLKGFKPAERVEFWRRFGGRIEALQAQAGKSA